MADLSTLNVSEFEEHKEEWRAAEQWLDDNKEWTTRVDSPDGKFLLGVFTVGASGMMEIVSEVLIFHTSSIIGSLKKYCKKTQREYYSYNWLYASPDVKDFPEENDTPQSLGWPSHGCAVISFVPGTEFRKMVFGNEPRPVTHGKMPRGREKIDMRYVPYAHASAVAVASCAVPVHTSVPRKRF
jgi:hypothetical protein